MAFAQHKVSFELGDGRPIIGCILKEAYRLEPGRAAVPLDAPPEIVLEQRREGPDDRSELLAEPDSAVLGALGVDVIVHGRVHAPGGGATCVDAAVQIGTYRKTIRAWGDRVVERGPGGVLRFSAPAPFVSAALSYRAAFGGVDEGSGDDGVEAIAYPRNPVGRGFRVGGPPERLLGLLAPTFEDPDDPLTPSRMQVAEEDGWPYAPLPTGLGPIDRLTFPRVAHWLPIGPTLPTDLEELRRGFLSAADLEHRSLDRGPDPRGLSSASPGLRHLPLVGGEPLVLERLHPAGPLVASRIPSTRIAVTFYPPACAPEHVAAALRKVEIHPEASAMVLTFAAMIEVAAPFPPEVLDRVDIRWRYS